MCLRATTLWAKWVMEVIVIIVTTVTKRHNLANGAQIGNMGEVFVNKPKVVSVRGLALKSLGAIRVDRGSEWGNPFLMHAHTEKERQRVCDLYEVYARWRLTVEPEWLVLLRGKDLACWCAPHRCHADTLLRLANPTLNDPEEGALSIAIGFSHACLCDPE